ncbi:hypothetical protein LEP1GSC058_3312 [Leptospira fainei serovar Hurstbridge str. BUT 6]|uniref:Uncharacterized protein n=1 Tax=Leptospira fainei serovar Hurstbridge str. BUT 6 TaxID=1193011 RepID=S3W0V6_9LEPT|nr:hypothetical protein LEP1GSC058_3312 [Leptospira fainei serovar Hurstbridge str. BUT 6]
MIHFSAILILFKFLNYKGKAYKKDIFGNCLPFFVYFFIFERIVFTIIGSLDFSNPRNDNSIS